MIEVELKYPVESLTGIKSRFQAIGAVAHLVNVQSDEYLNDPIRDFAKQDKALRIRSSDGRYYLTFKGPRLDPIAKIRLELEIPLDSQASAGMMSLMFQQIGFDSVANVVKRRETMSVNWAGDCIEICLDEVEEVGTFVELELVVEEENEKELAKQKLISLAEQVGLSDSIHTSYLELLLQSRGEL